MNLHLLDGIDVESRLANASNKDAIVILNYLKARDNYIKYHKLNYFKADDWQKNAIALGIEEEVRGAICANRIGKSYFGTYELSVHVTGRYPDDWTGYKFKAPIASLCLGVDMKSIAKPDAVQELILGKPADRGTGFIPKEDILDIVNAMGQGKGVAGKVFIQHHDEKGNPDGVSELHFGSYSQGQDTIMGQALQFVLIDECPKDKTILPQCVKRTNSFLGDARVLCTFTPEHGLNDTVEAFWDDKGIYHEGLIHASLWDSSLYTEERKVIMNKNLPPWQRGFSIEGIPSAGSGAVMAGILKDSILDTNFRIGKDWPRICSIDFGFKDDNVVLFFAKDPNTGIIYMYDELHHVEVDASIIAVGIKEKQLGFIPMVYPPDGLAEKGTGVSLMSIYEKAGVIKGAPARNYELDITGHDRSIKNGLTWMRQQMIAGTLKVSPRCSYFLKEFDLYSYDEQGKLIDKNNHAMDCCRYGIMAINRYGVTEQSFINKSNNTVDDYYMNEYLDSVNNCM